MVDLTKASYFEYDGLPYAVWTTNGSSFFMSGDNTDDWAKINSDVVSKVRLRGSPIDKAQAFDMAEELSVPEAEEGGYPT